MKNEWFFRDGFYTILASVNEEEILDEIVQHFNEQNPGSSIKEITIDMYNLEHIFDELLKFQKKVTHYGIYYPHKQVRYNCFLPSISFQGCYNCKI
jgi:phage terminase large subunit-like protein